MNAEEDAAYERDGPTRALPRAAYLELWGPRQGEGRFARSPLEIEVSLGEQDLRDKDGFGFSLRFRRVMVALAFERCELAREGRYERTLPTEDFVQLLKVVNDTSRSAKGQAKGGVSNLLSSVLSLLGVEASAHGEVAASLNRGDSRIVESQISFKIVRFIAGGRWEIGHPELGDPSEFDRILRGSYLSKPADGRKDDDYNPLCTVEPLGHRPYAVTVELRARKADCVYSPIGDEPGGDAWEKENKSVIEQVLALKMLEESNRADGLDPPDGEIILARARLRVRAKKKQKGET